MKTFLLLPTACLVTAAFAQDLSWNDLARRPELWPSQCVMKVPIKFESGAAVQAGQTVDVVQFKGNEVDVRTIDGKVNFGAAPEETDVLDVARAAYSKLTPKQRALTYASLAQKRELWPAQVTVKRKFDVALGKTVNVGDQLTLEEIQPGKLTVGSEKWKVRFDLAPDATDVITQARQFVESDPGVSPRFLAEQQAAEAKKRVEQRIRAQGPVVTELEGKLISSTTGQPEPLDTNSLPRYFVFLRGSSTCSITRGFTPKLIHFYEEAKPKHPEFEVIWLMCDSDADTAKFAKELGFSWRAVEYDITPTVTSVHRVIDGKLPQLIVMDRNGRVLANGIQQSAPAALNQLDALLKQPQTTVQN